MDEQRPDPIDSEMDSEAAGPPAGSRERTQEVATRFGKFLGRSAQRARALSEEAAREARPEIERLARAARTAAETARPRIEEAGRSASRYVREHDADIRRAARVGAEVTAHQVMPARIRPIVAAIEADRWRRTPLRDERAGPDAGEIPDSSTAPQESDPQEPDPPAASDRPSM